MTRHPRTTPLCTVITWMLVALMVEPQTRVLGQESSTYVRALEVLLAPPAASSRTSAAQSPILMAAAQTPLLDTPAGGDTGNNMRAAAVDPNLLLNLTRTSITLTNGHEMLGLSFYSGSNHNYVVEFRDDIGFDLCNQWQPLTNAPHNYGIVFTESQATNRFFRLRRIDMPRSPLFALLAHDTGTNSLDGITSEPTITGMALTFPAGTELRASLNNLAGPFTIITNLGSPRYFLLSRGQLATLNGGSLPDGNHTLHLRAMDVAQNVLGSFELSFTLDTAPPTVTVSLAPAFDSPPLGDGRTTFNSVTLIGQTEPGTRLELLATTSPGGASTPVIHQIVPDANGSFVLTNFVLAQGTNQFFFRALDAACNETISESRLCWYGSDCAFPDNLEGWQVAVSPTAGISGSVTVAPDKLCAAVMNEGDSFLVTLSRDFLIPTIPSVLSLNYQVTFDTTATHLMRDAFEVALVDGAGRPLTYTIQGTNAVTPASVATPPVLPPSPDALLNHTDGHAPFNASGTALDTQSSTLLVDVRHLLPGSTARLILRLVNNDHDSATTVRVTDVRFKALDSSLNLVGSPPTALSLLTGSGASGVPVSATANTNCPIGNPSFSGSPNTGPKIVFGSTNGSAIFPTNSGAIQVKVYSGHTTFGGGAPYSGLVGSFTATAVSFATDTGYNWHPFGMYDFGADITGSFVAPTNGIYTFTLNSDDGSVLFVDGTLVLDNGNPHGPGIVSGTVPLASGLHSFEIQFFECCGGPSGVDMGLPAGSTYFSSVPASPTLAIVTPSDDSRLAPGAVLMSGYALADRPDIFGIPATNSVFLVTVNGTPVDALDTAGNFFSAIDVRPGQNVFEVVATDAFNQSTTNTVTVHGTTCPQNFASLGEVSASVVPEYGRTSFNEWTKVLYADLALRNAGTYLIRARFYVGVNRISDPTVKLLAPDGVSADGIPYYAYSGTLTGESLTAGSLTAARALAFHNPNKVQFAYELVVLGQLNQAPAFTTTPVLEVIAGKPYSYAFKATDPDGDLLTYSLTTGPAGLTLNSQLQTLIWSPSATNLGTHNIRLRADDGKGGIAEQHYLLSVINQLSNRPPVITSIPKTQYRLAQTVVPLGYEPTVVLPYDGVGFRYREGDVLGFESLDFDDSNFSVGNAGFGSGGNCAVQSQVRTHWNVFTTLLVRGRVFLPKGTKNVRVAATIDNDMQLYFNGVDVSGYIVHGGCPTRGEFTFVVPDSLLRDGANLIAVRAIDYGSESYFEMQVSADIPVGIASYIYDVEARDPDNDVLVYSLVESPPGMVIEPFTGLVHWGPTADHIGTHNVTVQVADGRGGIAKQIYRICVLPTEDHQVALDVRCPTNIALGGDGTIRGAVLIEPAELTNFVLVADSFGDFSGEQGGKNWFYGFYDRQHDGDRQYQASDFRQSGRFSGIIAWTEGFNGIWWTEGESIYTSPYWTLLDSIGGHGNGLYGGRTAAEHWVVRRWVSPIDAQCQVVGRLCKLQLGGNPPHNGVIGHFYLNGNEIWSAAIEHTDGPPTFDSSNLLARIENYGVGFTNFVTVKRGDILDFVIDPKDANERSDTSAFRLRISAPQAPERIVFLDRDCNRSRDIGEPFVVTELNGDYVFTNLAPDTYQIVLEPVPGWVTTSPSGGRHEVRLDTLETITNLNFLLSLGAANELRPPSFTSEPLNTVVAGQVFRYFASASDANGDLLAYDLVTHPEGMLVETNSGVVAWRPLLNKLGTHDVILRVQDGRGGVAIQSWQITVTAPNSPPFITTFPPGPAVVGLPYRYAIRAQDQESQPLTFALTMNAPAGLTITSGSSNTALISWTPALAQLGTNPVEIIVRDSEGAESRQSFGLEVVVSAPNRPPAITSTPRTQTRVGGDYAYVIEVSDLDGDRVTVTLLSGPSGMVVTNLSVTDGVESVPTIYWPGAELGSHTIQLRASDGRSGTADQQFTLNVASSLNNQPPLITSLPLEHATAGQTYDYQLTASDPDGDAVTWRVLTGPVGMSLDSATGRLLWIPTLEQVGTNAVVIEVTDALLATATQTFSIEVGCLNRPPQITSVPPTTAQTGEPYLYAPRGNDPDGDRLSWSLVPGQFPPGMTIDGTNGLVRWTPTTNQLGSAIVSVRVTDGRGGYDTQTFTLYAANLRANHAPIIVTTPPRGATVGRPYSYNLRATDADGDALTLQSLASLPDGATFVPSSGGQGLLSWTPQPGQQGQQEFILTARDSAGASASQRFFVTVRSNQAPAIVSVPRTNAVPGVTYRYDVSAFDPDGDALTYAFTSPVPTGMTMDALGRITWTPSLVQTGSFSVTAAVSDPFAGSTDQSFTITVAADSQPPIVSLTVIPGTTDSEGLPTFDLNQQVRFRVTAADNVGVAEVQLTVSSNPVALSGETGFFTSTEVGRFPVVATARDAAGNLGIATNTLRVVDRNATNNIFVQIIIPVTGATLTAPAHIVVTITNAFDLQFYRVDYARADQVDLNDITANPAAFIPLTGNIPIAAGTKALNNTVLATFDPTLLLNDAYLIRVYAEDVNGLGWYEPALIGVSGNLKFGEFRLEFTDLAVPLAGIPITIGRVYDSRDSRRQGDFGYGWSLGAQDAQIRETLRAGTMFNGSRVYLNTPDGRRVGFTAYPELIGAFGFVFVHVKFRPDPGVFEKLEINGDDGAVLLGADFLGGLGDENFNPDKYRLTTKDGTVYEYDQRTGLQRVTDLNANRLDYTRDGILHYPAGSATPDQSIPFIRDAQGRITQIIDPNGKALRYSYDGLGDLRSFTDQVTNTTRYAYSASRAHFLTNIVDPLGRSALSIEYDSAGRLKTVRDANGNPISQDFDVDSKSATFTDGNGNVIHTRFDDNGNEIVRRIDGVSTNYFAFDANNNLLASTNGRGFSTNFTYDARGNVTSITDSLSNRTTIAYSAQNKPIGVTNALGQVISLAYNSSGQLTQVVNNAGFKTSVSRDGMGRVASLTDATGTNTTTFDYNGGCACGKPGKVINPDGSFKITEYNSLGQVTREVNELGAEKLSFFDDTGKLLWTRDPLTNYTQFFYRGPLLTNVVDALGRSTRYEYDSLNRTNKIIDAENGVVEFRYDNNGNRTHVIDAVTNVTTFVYDTANRLKMQIDPLGHTNFFGYDAAGNRTEAIDRNGRKRTFRYDAANRMTNELWWEGTNVVRSIVFGFNELGVQTLAADQAARYTYSYDSLNRLERVLSQSAGVPDFTLLYTYTSLGQVESVTDNYGVRVGSGYDNRNRLAQRTWQGPGVDPARVDFTFDVTGNRTRTDRYADLAGANRVGFTTNAYNHAGIVTNITHAGPTGTVLAKYDYHFDAAYQIRNWTINNQPSAFEYDRTGQLTNALNTTQPDENFRFDANGNRVGAQSGGSYGVGRNNQILSDGTNNYAYDAEGNMTSRSNTVSGVLTTYQWDHRNRLTSVLDRNPVGVVTQTVAFVYDAMNRRLSKTVSGTQATNVVRFLYNGDDSWADLDGTNAVTARYLHGARIDELLARQRASDGRGWYLTDHLGTVRDIANAAGAAIVHVDYSSFGQVLGVSNPTAADRFLFTGREMDAETGLYFYRARFYSVILGRFVSDDPIAFASGDLNLYRYTANNPLIAFDPTGTISLTEFVIHSSLLTGLFAGFAGATCEQDEKKIFVTFGRNFLLGAMIGALAAFLPEASITESALVGVFGLSFTQFIGQLFIICPEVLSK